MSVNIRAYSYVYQNLYLEHTLDSCVLEYEACEVTATIDIRKWVSD